MKATLSLWSGLVTGFAAPTGIGAPQSAAQALTRPPRRATLVPMDRLQIANLVMMFLFGAAALRWGAAPERICVAILGFVTLADPVYHLLAGHGAIYGSVDLGHLTFDLMMAAGFIAVALWANRIYPLWLAAFSSSR